MSISSIKLYSNYYLIDHDILDVRFCYVLDDNTEGEMRIGLNKDGKIEKCSSLISSLDNFNYYLQIADVIKDINKIQSEEGKYLYHKINHISDVCGKNIIETYKEYETRNTNYLEDDIEEMEKQYRRLRKHEKKEALKKEINDKKSQLKQLNEYNEKIYNIISETNDKYRLEAIKEAENVLNNVFEKLYD